MTSAHPCPTCGAALSVDTADGLCLTCLGRLAFGDASGAGALADRRRLGDYELLEEIDRGGMGVVYRARQLSLHRIVAVKVMVAGPFAGPDFVRRFQTEAEAAAALRHPNIVTIFEVGERDGTHFLAMEYIEGQSFSQLVREQPLTAPRAANYIQAIALAVQHAHDRGVLHRDLKPSNLLLDVFDQPRITDFGLAKFLHRPGEATLPGAVLGSPNFMPPEQAAGNPATMAAASDVYSLGAVLYHLLTGRPPFQGETFHEVLAQVQGADPVPPRKLNPSIPPDLQTICLKCLQKEPARRYATARALAEDLGRFRNGEPILAHPVSFVESLWLWCQRRPALAGLILALHLVFAAGLAGIVWQWQRATLHARAETQLRRTAEQTTEATRLNLYAADVALAAQVMQEGDFGRARQILERLRPQAGQTDLRGFEWRYLSHACQGGQLATLGQHEWIVTCVAFAPDGQSIASGGMGGEVKIWDTHSLACQKSFRVDTRAVWSVAFTPDSAGLWVCSSNVQLRDVRTGQIRRQFPGQLAAQAHNGSVVATAEGNPFFWEEAGLVHLWDFATGKLLRTLEEPGRRLALSPDGRILAVAAATTGVHLYDTTSGTRLRTLPTAKPVWSLHFSPGGEELVTAGWSGDILLWPTASEAPARVLKDSAFSVWDADFSPSGKLLIIAGSDQTIRLRDRATLELITTLRGHESEVWCAAFSPDETRIVSGGKDRNVMLWPAAGRAATTEIPHENAAIPLFSPHCTYLATVDPGPGGAYALWRVTNRTLLATNLAQRQVVVGFSVDDQQLAALADDQRALNFWPIPAGTAAHTVRLAGLPADIGAAACWGMSPDQNYFFAIASNGVARVWQTADGALVGSVAGPPAPIRNGVLSAQGRYLAISVERDSAVTLFDRGTGQTRRLEGHHDFVSGLDFSPDGTTLATGSMDGTIRLWRTADGAPAGSLPGHLQETTDVAFSPDGRTLASVGEEETVKLWHLPTLREVYSLRLPKAGRHLRFSPDGKWLAVNTEADKLLLLEAP